MTNTTSATVHLQGIGRCDAKPAADLVPGDITVWNYGYTAEVLSVVPSVTGRSVTATLRWETVGVRSRRFNASRLVAVMVRS